MKVSKGKSRPDSTGSVPKVSAATNTKYGESIQYIRAAIDALGRVAKTDPEAKGAIADLGVVLFDLTDRDS